MIGPARALAGLSALLLLAGCGSSPVPHWAYDAQRDAGADYRQALQRWTRAGATYEHFEGRVFVSATYFSPSFAGTFSRFEAERLALPASEAAKRLEQRLGQAQSEARFFVALNTHDDRWNDLEKRAGTLRVVLVEGGEEVPALQIIRLTKTQAADLGPFFGYLGPLHVGYWITFPKPTKPLRVHLRLAGPPAVVDLLWRSS